MPRLLVFFLLCLPLWPQQTDARLEELRATAATALRRGDFRGSASALEEGLRLKPDWKEGLWALGWTHFKAGRCEAARQAMISLIRQDGTSGAAWSILGLCEFQARDYGMALQDLQRGIALGVSAETGLRPAVRYHAAAALGLGGRFEAAVELLGDAAREGERTPEVLLTTGLAALRLPLLASQAVEALPAERLEIARRTGEALYEAARHKPKETERIFQGIFAQYPAATRVHHAYGYFLVGAGDLTKAEAEFRAELRLDAESAPARLGLAHVALEGGKTDAAVELARDAVRIAPEAATGRFLLGRALLRAGQAEEAARELEAARDREPASSKVRFELVRAYRENGRMEEAAREAETFERLKRLEDELKSRGRVPAEMLKEN